VFVFAPDTTLRYQKVIVTFAPDLRRDLFRDVAEYLHYRYLTTRIGNTDTPNAAPTTPRRLHGRMGVRAACQAGSSQGDAQQEA
jgi:hypothetical protein